MVMRGSKFLEAQNRLKAAAQQQNMPGVSDTEETTTPETNPIQEPKKSSVLDTIGTVAAYLNPITAPLAAVKVAVNGMNRIKESDTQLGEIIRKSQTALNAEETKKQNTQDIEQIKTENADIKKALYLDAELEEDISARERLADRRDRLAEEDGVTRKDVISLGTRGLIKQGSKLAHKYLPQSRQDNAGSGYLSDGKIVAKNPALQKTDNLANAKNLAASIQYAYAKDGKIVDAKTVKEMVPEFADVEEDDLERFINGCLYSYANNQPIDRDMVAEKYGSVVKSDEYMSKKSAISDLLLSDVAYLYGLDAETEKEINEDPELQKVIKAYQYIGMYADLLNENGYNFYDSSSRGLAQTYKDYDIGAEGAEMSLKDAYDTIANYKDTKLQNLVDRIEYNLQQAESSKEADIRRAEQRPGRWNTRAALKNFGAARVALADDFENWSVQTQAEAKGRDPGRIFNALLVEQTWTDEEGNIRDMTGDLLYERHEDGSYVDKNGNNVTDMINGTGPNYVRDTFKKKPHKGLFGNMAGHLDGIIQGADKTMENLQDFGGEENGRRNIQNYLGTANGAVSTRFQTSLLLNPKFIALETLPGSRQAIDVAFSELANLGSTAMMDFLTVTQLANKMDEDSINEARELGSTVVTIMAMKKRKKETDPYKKAFKEAVEKTFEKYKDRMVDVQKRGELNEKIKAPVEKEEENKKPGGPDDTTPPSAGTAKRTEVKEPTKTETIGTTDTTKVTETTVAKAEGGKDSGYTFTVNRATISEMIKDFKEEYKKAVEKNVPESSILRSLTEFAEEFKDVPKDLINTAKGMTFSEIVENIQEGMQRMWDNTKEATQRITEKLGTRATRKRQADAYEKMKLSTEEIDTIENNSMTGKLGRILQRFVSSKKGKIIKELNATPNQVKQTVKDNVVKDFINEQIGAAIERLAEWKKKIQRDFYQGLSDVKNINFGEFFLGRSGIKKALKEIIKGTDEGTYVKIKEIDGKIVVEFKKGYSPYFYDYVRPVIEKIVESYNELVEGGNISEQNILNILGEMKKLRNQGNAMRTKGKNDGDRNLEEEGFAVENAGNSLIRVLEGFLEEKGIGNKLLVGQKAESAYAKMNKAVENLVTNGKADETKIKSFFDKLSKNKTLGEDIESDPTVQALKGLGIDMSEYLDLYRNGSTIVEKIFKLKLGVKEFESTMGKIFKKTGNIKASGLGKFGTLIGGVLLKGPFGRLLALIGGLGILTSPIDRALERLNNKTYQKNLNKALDKALKDPKNARTAQDIIEGINQTVQEIDEKINAVIEKRANNNQKKATELGTPENPIVGEAPEQKKALPYREDPEAELNNAISDLETQTTDALRQLNEMVKDSYRDGEDIDGPDDTTPPTGPTGPDKGGNGGGEDPISEFIKIIEGDAPEGGEGKPDFSKWSNESLSKLFDKNGDFKKGVPEEYKEEISNEMTSRTIKQEIDDSEVRTQNNIIRAIANQLDQIAEGKAEDNIREKYNEQVMQAWNTDTNRADEIIGDIVNGVITESDVYQDKTTYEDNQEASNRIEKRTGKKTKTTKSVSKTSSLEVRDTKPDSQGKLNALKTQLEQKRKALPKVKSAKTLQKKQAEIDKLEKEITRIEEKLGAKPLDNFDIADKEAVDNMIAEEEKPQVQPSEEKISEPQEEKVDEMSTLMTFNPENATAEEIKKTQIALTKKKNDGDLGIYKKNEVERKINELNEARIEKEEDGKKEKLDYDYSDYDDRYQLQVYKGRRGYDTEDTPGAGEDIEFYTNNSDRALTYAKKGATQYDIKSEMFRVKAKDTKIIDSEGVARNQYVDDNGNIVEGKTAKNGPHNYINYNNKIAKEEGKKVVIYKGIKDTGPFKPRGKIDLGGDDIVVLEPKILTEF